jgi:hypothetical protein
MSIMSMRVIGLESSVASQYLLAILFRWLVTGMADSRESDTMLRYEARLWTIALVSDTRNNLFLI